MNKLYVIKILSTGPIKTMGGVHGPIITPYAVKYDKLVALLSEGLNIVQINDDKTETPITLSDIISDTDTKKNGNTKKAKKAEVVAPVVETVEEPATEVVAPVVETVEESPVETEADGDADNEAVTAVEPVIPEIPVRQNNSNRSRNNNRRH